MSLMFLDASAFNQNLCDWGKAMKARNTETYGMFMRSNCPSTDDPNYANTPVSPLCKATCVAKSS
jgi:hypothetical protein